jgi:hypothetical protein
MTEEELDAFVEAKLADRLAARLEAERGRLRAEVISELRRGSPHGSRNVIPHW